MNYLYIVGLWFMCNNHQKNWIFEKLQSTNKWIFLNYITPILFLIKFICGGDPNTIGNLDKCDERPYIRQYNMESNNIPASNWKR